MGKWLYKRHGEQVTAAAIAAATFTQPTAAYFAKTIRQYPPFREGGAGSHDRKRADFCKIGALVG